MSSRRRRVNQRHVEPFLRARHATTGNDLLRHTKHIEVISKIYTVKNWDEYRASHSGESEELAAELAASLLPVIEACRDKSLESFLWVLLIVAEKPMCELGFCR
jgi:hypothetical protein